MPGQISQKGYNQADLVDLLRAMRNRVLGVSALPNVAPGTTASKLKLTATTTYMADGVLVIKTTADELTAIATHSARVLTATQGAAFRLELDSAGTLTALMGPIVPAAAGDALVTYLPMPIRTPNRCTVGYLLVQGVFTPGTTSITAGMCNDGDPDLIPGVNLAGVSTTGLVS